MAKAVSVRHLGFSYGGSAVLDDVSFEVERGEFFGIVGPNGSGKTTLLKLLTGVARAERGEILLFDRDIRHMRHREIARVVAVVPQETTLTFPFSVRQIVLMGRAPYLGAFAFESERDFEIAQAAMAQTDTCHLSARLFTALSGGEKQRVIIARALAQQPQIMLLDEPTTFLDIRHEFEIYDLLRALNRRDGLTVIAICHNLNLASQYCSKIMMLNGGKVFTVGAPAEVLTEANIKEVYRAEVCVEHRRDYGFPLILPPRT